MRQLTIPVVGLLLCMAASAQRPTPEQQKRTLDTAREIAIHYSSKLPDFICAENVERTDSVSPTVFKADRLTIQLSYFGQKEKYKLLTINGNPTEQSLESLDGIISGVNSAACCSVFSTRRPPPISNGSRATELRKHTAAVYTYRVTRAKSHYMVGSRAQAGNLVAAAAGYHGEVVLDSQTRKVLRLTASADDIPSDSGSPAIFRGSGLRLH